jgi:hypothetical protein
MFRACLEQRTSALFSFRGIDGCSPRRKSQNLAEEPLRLACREVGETLLRSLGLFRCSNEQHHCQSYPSRYPWRISYSFVQNEREDTKPASAYSDVIISHSLHPTPGKYIVCFASSMIPPGFSTCYYIQRET